MAIDCRARGFKLTIMAASRSLAAATLRGLVRPRASRVGVVRARRGLADAPGAGSGAAAAGETPGPDEQEQIKKFLEPIGLVHLADKFKTFKQVLESRSPALKELGIPVRERKRIRGAASLYSLENEIYTAFKDKPEKPIKPKAAAGEKGAAGDKAPKKK
jgi:hypothetical protein